LILLFYLRIAPVASALCNKFGCRPIGIIGSIISAAAVAASIWSANIAIMWLLFGVIGGIGMGLIYLPSIVMVGYYFEEKRAIATGRMNCVFIIIIVDWI
jgi:MFS family permease